MASIIPQYGYGQDYLKTQFSPSSDSMLGEALGGYPQTPSPAAYVPGTLNMPWSNSVMSSASGNNSTMPIQGSGAVSSPMFAPALSLAGMGMSGSAPASVLSGTPNYAYEQPITSLPGFGTGDGSLSSGGLNLFSGSNPSLLSGVGGQSPSWFSGLGDWASKNKELISGGVGLATAGLGAFNAWNTNQQAKDQLKFQKESFGKQYEAQKGLTNSQLSDRQTRRVNERGDRAESVESYMNKYGVK